MSAVIDPALTFGLSVKAITHKGDGKQQGRNRHDGKQIQHAGGVFYNVIKQNRANGTRGAEACVIDIFPLSINGRQDRHHDSDQVEQGVSTAEVLIKASLYHQAKKEQCEHIEK